MKLKLLFLFFVWTIIISGQKVTIDLSTGKNDDGTLMNAPAPDVADGVSVLEPDWSVIRPGETTSVATKTRHTFTGWSTPILTLTAGNGIQSRWITDVSWSAVFGDYFYTSRSFQIPNGATNAVLNLRSLSFVRNWTYLVRTDVIPNIEEEITRTTWMSDGAKGWLNSRSPEVYNKTLVPGATYMIKVRVYTNNSTVSNALNVQGLVSYTPQACITSEPTVNSIVNYCQNDIASPLTATGTGLLWYVSETGGVGSATAPIPDTTIAGNVSYYVSQTENGCESKRVKVDVKVNATPNLPTVISSIAYCINDVALPLTANGTDLLWYTTEKGGVGSLTAPIPDTRVVGTTSYYVSQKENGCESARAKIDVMVNPTTIITLSSSNDSQKIIANESIQNIIYTFSNANSVNVSNLPTGITSNINGNILTISGTATELGVFNYTVNANGKCGNIVLNGKIEIVKGVDNRLAPNSYVFDIDWAKSNNIGGLKIPVAKAYKMWEDASGYLKQPIPSSGAQTATVYWEDVPGLVRNVSIGDGVGKDAKIKVMIDKAKGKGNAVIAFKVDGTVYWSWHIWVTDNPENGAEFGHTVGTEKVEFFGSNNTNCENCPDAGSTFFTPKYMDRNLGAVSNSFLGKDWHKSGGLMYQWGRKDPLPPLIYKDDSYYEVSGDAGVYRAPLSNFKTGSVSYGEIYQYQRPSTSTIYDNIRYSVNNPLKPIFNSSDYTTKTWFNGTALDNLWSDNSKGKYETHPNFYSRRKGYLTKSYYDPCPNGWRLPSHATANPWDDSIAKGIKLKFSPWGLDDEINNFDFESNKYYNIKPNDNNNYVKGLKIYPSLGVIMTNVNGLNMGVMPGTGKHDIYSNKKYYQDGHETHLWSATMENNSKLAPYAKGFSFIPDPSQSNNKPDEINYPSLKGLYDYRPNSNSHPAMATAACRCMKDPLFEVENYNFITEYVNDDVINYTEGINTANSYVVTKKAVAQTIKIPISKAFSVYNQYLSQHEMLSYDNLKTNVQWTTKRELITNLKVDQPASLEAVTNSYITVAIAPNQSGNALISLHNGSINNSIYWTWHIWVTNDDIKTINYQTENTYLENSSYVNWTNSGMQPKKNVFMDRNLGALNSLPSIAGVTPNAQQMQLIRDSGGMQYQWGRKDPLPTFITPGYNPSPIGYAGTAYSIFKTTTGPAANGDITNATYNVTLDGNTYKSIYAKYYSQISSNNSNKQIKIRENLLKTIQNPLLFVFQDTPLNSGSSLASGKDWLINEPGILPDRWGHAGEKSVFDPCPSGWRVPDFDAVTVNETYRKGNSPWYNGYYAPSGSDPLAYHSLGIEERKIVGTNGDPNTTSEFYYGKIIRNMVAWGARYGMQFDNPEIAGNPNTKYNIGNYPYTGIRGADNINLAYSSITPGYIGVWSAALNGNLQGYGLSLFINRDTSISTGNTQSPHLAMDVRCVEDKNGSSLRITKIENKLRDLLRESNNDNVQVYPNPFSDEISIVGKIDSYTIFDASGKVVLAGSDNKIKTMSLIEGFYLIRINLKDGTSISKKLIKK